MGESASVSCNFAASRQSSEPTSPLPSLGTMDAANNIETESGECIDVQLSNEIEESAPPLAGTSYVHRFLEFISKPTPSLPSLGPMDAANNTSTDSKPTSSLPPLQSLGTMDPANNSSTDTDYESAVFSIQINWLKGKLSRFKKKSRELDEPVLGIIPDVIRANHGKEYAPQIIAIGPYYRRQEPMVDMKLQFLSDLCRRVARNRSMTEEDVLINITTAVQLRGEEAERKYSQPLYPKTCMVEMLVLDGCFIVELLVKRQLDELLQALPMTFQNNILDSVVRDLLLYENQIPFFILEEIYGACFHATATDMSNSQSIRNLAINFFRYEKEFRDQEIVHHLLHLCHMNMVSEQNPRADQDNCTTIFCSFIKTIFNSLVMFMIFILLSPAILLFGFLFLIRSWWKYCLNQNKYVAPIEGKNIPTATELDKYGVQFRTKQIDGNASFIDVSFKDGIMVIPHTRIEDPTSSTYRNLLALEQSWSEYGNKFTSYVAFMDDLIDTADDVALLRKKMILVNCLGSDEEVAKIFNEMCLELSFSSSEGYLVDMYGDINKYCDGTYNKWRATLMRDYLNSPWSIISVLAVSFVICLAVVQTVCSIIQVKTGK